MNDKNINEVTISGIIKSITPVNGYYLINIKAYKFTNDKYKDVYVGLSIYNDLYEKYKDILFKDNKVFFKGYLNSYKDKQDKFNTFISITEIYKNYEYLTKGKTGPHIRYDPDGVMVWNGKRCEIQPLDDKEK